ncbi:MAG TPA: FtsW/RodA/SpoVE family cell cycle protein [Solirubrobacterales bacterium]|nr:FtsW/RodA/SpoVE family cell cycle protein [Solirubrobacterales bacterium]
MLVVVVVTGEPLLLAVILPILVNLVSNSADRILAAGLPPLPMPPSWVKLPRLTRIGRINRKVPLGRLLMVVSLALLTIGAAMVTSAVTHVPGEVGGEPQASFHLIRFLFFGGVGLVVLYALARIDLGTIKALSAPLLWISMLLLVAVLIPGVGLESFSGRRWIGWGALAIQPAELTKLAIVFYAAKSLADRETSDLSARVRAISLLATGACFLMVLEPDLGAALVVAFSIGSVLFAASLPTGRIAAAMGMSLWLVTLEIVLSDAGRSRIAAFVNPWGDGSSGSFQAVQGLIALGSGGLFGRGYGNSVQKAFYLPEAHTTFILAVIGEELGAIGVCLILLLFALIAYAGLRTARQARDEYARILATGLTILVVGQCLLNAYWVLGLAPATDVGMPLVSYGLTSLLVTLGAIGVLLNLAIRQRVGEATPPPWVVGGSLAARSRTAVRRIGLAFAVLLLLLGIGAGRALWLGVVDASDLREKAHLQQTEVVQIPARRGTIYDRDGSPLAVSKPAADVLFIPRYLKEADLSALDRRLTPTERALLRTIPSTDSSFHYLLNDVSRKRGSSFKYRHLHVLGVVNVPTYRREYSHAGLGAGLLGRLNREGDGTAGIEQALQPRLAGENGERNVILDALGRPVGNDILDTSESGENVRLSINSSTQALVEESLANASTRLGGGVESAVVLDARSGQILAMSDGPAPDAAVPNTVAAVGESFEPGSALDAFTVAAGLEEGLITPTETFVLPSAIGSVAVDDTEEEAGTRLSSRQILVQSSDPGTVLIALRLRPPRFARWMERFGFGRRTGIELPAEQPGLIPTAEENSLATMGSAPVGRGASVTLVQLAAAYASLVNGGLRVEPTLVMDGNRSRERLLSLPVSIEVSSALRSGSGGEVPQISARTGTYSTSWSYASFIGFVPRTDSTLVVAVFLEAMIGSGENSAEDLFTSIRAGLERQLLP